MSAGPVLGWTTKGRDGARCMESLRRASCVRSLCAVDLTVCAQWAPRVWGLGLHSTIEGGLGDPSAHGLVVCSCFGFVKVVFRCREL